MRSTRHLVEQLWRWRLNRLFAICIGEGEAAPACSAPRSTPPKTRALRPPAHPQRIHSASMDFGWGAGPLSAGAGGGGSDLNLLSDNLLLDLDDRTLQVQWMLAAVICLAAAPGQRQFA